MKKIIPTGQHRTLNINQRWLVIDALTGPISMQIAGLAPFELSGPQLLDMLGYTSAEVWHDNLADVTMTYRTAPVPVLSINTVAISGAVGLDDASIHALGQEIGEDIQADVTVNLADLTIDAGQVADLKTVSVNNIPATLLREGGNVVANVPGNLLREGGNVVANVPGDLLREGGNVVANVPGNLLREGGHVRIQVAEPAQVIRAAATWTPGSGTVAFLMLWAPVGVSVRILEAVAARAQGGAYFLYRIAGSNLPGAFFSPELDDGQTYGGAVLAKAAAADLASSILPYATFMGGFMMGNRAIDNHAPVDIRAEVAEGICITGNVGEIINATIRAVEL